MKNLKRLSLFPMPLLLRQKNHINSDLEVVAHWSQRHHQYYFPGGICRWR